MNKSKQTRNYTRKYGKALKGAPITDYKDLLIQGKDNQLKKINPLDVRYKGTTFGLILDMYEDLNKQHNEYKKAVGHSISALIATLKVKGYNTPNVRLNTLIEDINHLNIIIPNVQYSGFKLEGECIKGLGYDVIFEVKELPDDIYSGYWLSLIHI